MKDHAYHNRAQFDLAEFEALTRQQLAPSDVPHAADLRHNIPLYDMAALAPAAMDDTARQALMAEWGWVLGQSAGVIILKGAFADTSIVDAATEVFRQIIADEKASTAGKGDHFAASGANDRVWNALQKHCLADAESFALYYGNPNIALACEAWLGPHYQMTAQVNQVRPGGAAQQAHRDYHLGFQSADEAARFPAHAHALTATLTLQGAVAHCDMPVESGPTKLLPFSQLYKPGYLAFHDEAHRAHFEAAYVQAPLAKGDAVFFNPALFHAAGENSSQDILRMANLLQISSPFGRAMEAIDRKKCSLALYPVLADLQAKRRLTGAALDAAIAACAEGYSFPTNLDTDPPLGGNAPTTQADLMRQALAEGWETARFTKALEDLAERQQP